jgi:hypothetical protein
MVNFYGIRHLILISIFIITILVFPQTATLTSTFSLHDENGVSIPFQNGIPVPTFAKQDRQIIDLNGIWKSNGSMLTIIFPCQQEILLVIIMY